MFDRWLAGKWRVVLASLALLVALSSLAASPAWAIQIDITKEGGLQALPIALPDFVSLDPGGAPGLPGEMGRKLVELVTADLEGSGLFRAVPRAGHLQDPVSLWKGASYKDWRLVGAEAVVSGAVREAGGKLVVDFYLHNVYRGTLWGKGKRFTSSPADWRFVAHRVADEIYTRVTGEGPYFASRVAFIAEKGKRKWLSLMDQDGANRLDLQVGSAIALTPRFSPDGGRLFYVSFETGEPRIFRWDLYEGRKFQQGDYPGLNSTPAWSPDGRRMAVTLSKDGNAEIYIKDLFSQGLTRLTQNSAIDTSPTWSPDGRQIAFTSDRGGGPQIYVMGADGQNVRRITYEGKNNTAPAWSPSGDKVAFVMGGGGRFRIAVTDPEGAAVRVLTDSWMDESPTWSPNGRVLIFSRQEGSHTRLYTIDHTGHNERLVPVGDGIEASDPSWSPLIR
ncbi:MAG: Tol-Pal system beta propeller repeat protein TolB [Magnetococcales bacterium]|nr:Tol-Pal system beta propeller repeat protein TolB [Magnetococcales bacterium]